jgi:catechol 2,3-dioxygenase-like lactoylglutathione lyase family enzyme
MMPMPKSAKKQKPKVSFNHAMIYVRDVARALHFYQDLLGLKSIDVFQFGSRPVYARLQSPVGTTTIALHQVEPGQELPPFDSIRLYFEVKFTTMLIKAARSWIPSARACKPKASRSLSCPSPCHRAGRMPT